jgi:antitoxin ParD1/3/4
MAKDVYHKYCLKNEQEQFIQKKLNSGNYESADEVIFEAFRLHEERDKHYEQCLQDTRQKVADGLARLDRGEGLDSEAVMARLKEQVHHARENHQ